METILSKNTINNPLIIQFTEPQCVETCSHKFPIRTLLQFY